MGFQLYEPTIVKVLTQLALHIDKLLPLLCMFGERDVLGYVDF